LKTPETEIEAEVHVPAATKPQRPDGSYHHVGMRVSDLDRSIRWYEQAFGFAVERQYALRHDADVRVCFMANPNGERIELFEFKDAPPKPEFAHPDDALRAGHAHFAFYVADIDAAFERAVAAGARVLWPPRRADLVETHTCYIADPDNNLIEFILKNEVWG
jgi:catechol 2,3-dioxygenase-like lactoylglutathione lyase family enzyme